MDSIKTVDYVHDLSLVLANVSYCLNIIILNLKMVEFGFEANCDFWKVIEALEENLMNVANLSSSELVENVNDSFDQLIEMLEIFVGEVPRYE